LISFEEFFEAERARLYRALYLVTGSASESEDLTQEAFVRLWERWDRVGRMERPVGYLFKAAMNLHRSRLRRARRAAAHAVAPGPAEDAFALIDTRRYIEAALIQLPVRQRAAIVLTELLGLSSEEAAQALGARPGTIRSLASQGREALRYALGDNDE
jgi:RNA polymerase sigma-70 factor, ECF subfamily